MKMMFTISTKNCNLLQFFSYNINNLKLTIMGILKVNAKCSDMCNLSYTDAKGKKHESDSYVPEGIGIGDYYGDYIEMDIDMETGQIQNWKPVSDKIVIAAMKKA